MSTGFVVCSTTEASWLIRVVAVIGAQRSENAAGIFLTLQEIYLKRNSVELQIEKMYQYITEITTGFIFLLLEVNL